MSGEGALSNIGSAWDAEGPPRLAALPAVAGRHEHDGWRVWISAGGVAASLDVTRARMLAADILDICQVVDGTSPALGDVK